MAKLKYVEDEIRQAIANGDSYEDIGKRYECTGSAVAKFCKKMSIFKKSSSLSEEISSEHRTIMQLLETGEKPKDISSVLGCSLSKVYWVANKYKHNFSADTIAQKYGVEILEAVHRGESFKTIANAIGCSHVAISKYCRAHGLDRRVNSFCSCGNPMKAWAKRCHVCSQRIENKYNKTKRRVKIKEQMVDTDITVLRLYERDNGVCYLCGGVCDLWDKQNICGTVICGDKYPSIDHIIPLSKGGFHSWENVKLAHRQCNTMKGAAIPPPEQIQRRPPEAGARKTLPTAGCF